MGKLTIDISDELIKLFPSKKEARSEAKQAMVFDLVRRGKISKGKAAELLGISLWDLPELLAQYDIPWFDYSPDDLKHDLNTLRKLENKGKEACGKRRSKSSWSPCPFDNSQGKRNYKESKTNS